MTPGEGAHEPTDETRAEVSRMAADGETQEDIGKIINIDDKTLRKYYRRELDVSKIKYKGVVVLALKDLIAKGDFNAIKYWLNCQGGWRSAESAVQASQTDDIKAELSALRAQLDAQNRKDY